MKLLSGDSFSLEGKVALVTGASSGLGEHFAKVLSRSGASVVVAARRKSKLEALVSELRKNGQSLATEMDVTCEESIDAGIENAVMEFGGIDILVNNAGVAAPASFLQGSEADWDFVMDTNVKAVWNLMKKCAQQMKKSRNGGSIVNISSILGVQPGKGHTHYSVSKAGVIQLTKNAALELWGENIRVNALCPGYFRTEMNKNFFDSEKGQRYLERIAPGRLGGLEELSGPLLLLVSEAGSFMNGVVLPVDGGHLCQSL